MNRERPLGEVLARRWLDDFTPRRPDRAPWHQGTLAHVEHTTTGNVVTVPLIVADRVTLHGLDRPSDERDDTEPGDWHPVTWGVSPSSTLPGQ